MGVLRSSLPQSHVRSRSKENHLNLTNSYCHEVDYRPQLNSKSGRKDLITSSSRRANVSLNRSKSRKEVLQEKILRYENQLNC